MTTPKDMQRKAFEKWYLEKYQIDLSQWRNDEDYSPLNKVNLIWEGWQLAIASQEQRISELQALVAKKDEALQDYEDDWVRTGWGFNALTRKKAKEALALKTGDVPPPLHANPTYKKLANTVAEHIWDMCQSYKPTKERIMAIVDSVLKNDQDYFEQAGDVQAPKEGWISIKDRLPQYDRSVFCYCEIMGRFIGYIDEHGTWHSWNEKGILPPTYWMEMPAAPTDTEGK